MFRAKRNILARSNVGLFASNRQASSGDYNRVFGADANFTILKNTDIQGFIGRSITPGLNGDDMVGRLKYNWLSDIYEVFVEHLYVGEDFQHDVGFVRRRGIQRTDTAFIWEPRPKRYNIRNFVFRGEVVYLTDTHRRILSREQIFQATTRFQNDDVVRVNTTGYFDRLEQPFEIASGITVPGGGLPLPRHLRGGRNQRQAPARRNRSGGQRNLLRRLPALRAGRRPPGGRRRSCHSSRLRME